jgi:hypothetical protein
MVTVDLPDSVMDLSRFGPGGSRPNNNVEMEVEGAEVQG